MNSNTQTRDNAAQHFEATQAAQPVQLQNCPLEDLLESTDIFVKSLKLGRVRGIACVFGFNTDFLHVAQELINRDILVLISSPDNPGRKKAAMAEPDFFQNTGDGLAEFCDFLGIQPAMCIDMALARAQLAHFYGKLAEQCAVAVSGLPTAAITLPLRLGHDENLGKLFPQSTSPTATADLVDKHIHDKREAALWCDRCGGHFSPFS